MDSTEKIPESIRFCSDGKYRWAYELAMMKTPVILFTVYKVLAIAFCVPLLVVLIADGFKDILGTIKVFILILLAVYVIGFIAYAIIAAIYGGRYCVIFTMDEKGITHAQQKKQFRKAQAVSAIEILAGAVSGNVTAVGSGLLAATKSEQYSQFDKVKKIKFVSKNNLIKLDYPLSHNQVYAEDDAFEFVSEYIRARCTGAKK